VQQVRRDEAARGFLQVIANRLPIMQAGSGKATGTQCINETKIHTEKMKAIEFHLPIVPPKATSQTKRLLIIKGKPMFFHKKEHQIAENDLTLLCSKHVPEQPIAGPVMLSVRFVFPWRKSEKKSVVAQGYAPHTSRPDLSNMIKLIEDVLTRLGFWNDDSQIARLDISKHWGNMPGITVTIQES
jgi:Holliday junction resolvase RusA-like endonuclease